MEAEKGRTVLLLEDQAMIAIDVEQLLREAGLNEIATHNSCRSAREWLGRQTPLIAIVETRLGDGPGRDIMDILESRAVPYIVHSVEMVGRPGAQPADMRWLEKPCNPAEFVRAVRECVAEATRPPTRSFP